MAELVETAEGESVVTTEEKMEGNRIVRAIVCAEDIYQHATHLRATVAWHPAPAQSATV